MAEKTTVGKSVRVRLELCDLQYTLGPMSKDVSTGGLPYVLIITDCSLLYGFVSITYMAIL